MSLFEELSEVNDKVKYSVYGWIRESARELNLEHIPDVIIAIAILYFRQIRDTFHIYDKEKLKVSNDCSIIETIRDCGSSVISYGKKEIVSTIPRKYKWDFNVNAGQNVCIGISTSTKIYSNIGDERAVYFMMGWGNKRWNIARKGGGFGVYGDFELKSGDNVSMCLDMRKRELSFVINDEDYGTAFKNIEQGDDVKYRLMVQIYDKGMSIECLNYEEC